MPRPPKNNQSIKHPSGRSRLKVTDSNSAEANALFDSIGEGAITTDQHGKISRINQAALDMLGYAHDELIGEWFPKAIESFNENGDPIPLIDRAITRSFILGVPISERTFYKTKQGMIFPADFTVSPILLDGKPIGAIEVFRDISREYQMDKMKSEFISIASHQLRTPLSVIKTYAYMLAKGYRGTLTQEQQTYMDTIIRSIESMNDLINTLLDISRLESGRFQVNHTHTDIVTLAHEVINGIHPHASEKDISLTFSPAPRRITVLTDPLLCKEAYANLLSNAIKYTPPGGKVTASVSRNGSRATFSVQDTGYGIPEAAHAKIFTKFYRAPNVMSRETSGTGLGLYMVKSLADTLGGRVWFDSEENVGSTFYFELPITT